jgi:hypothetical protein
VYLLNFITAKNNKVFILKSEEVITCCFGTFFPQLSCMLLILGGQIQDEWKKIRFDQVVVKVMFIKVGNFKVDK